MNIPHYTKIHNRFKLNGFHFSAEELKELPGIGEYTSKAIMAIAFNKKIIPLDGNLSLIHI